MNTAWIFRHSRSFFSIQYFWNVHDMICQAAILCSCFKRSLTLLAWLCSCGRCPQRSFSFSSSHSAWPFPKLGATNSAIWLPSWAKSVKLKVTHRLFFGLVLFGWLVGFFCCCCFVWVVFLAFCFCLFVFLLHCQGSSLIFHRLTAAEPVFSCTIYFQELSEITWYLI